MAEKNHIGLRTKLLTILAAGMLLVFVLLFFIGRTALLNGYKQLEKDNTLVYLSGAKALVAEQINQIEALAFDYAHWDDTYQFMVTRNQSYIKSNTTYETFATIRINALILVDAKGHIVFQNMVDFTSGKPWQIPDLLLRAVLKDGALINPPEHSVSGVFWTPEGSFIVASVDIRDSQSKGESRGTLIMIRPVSQKLLQHSSKILGVKLDIQPLHRIKVANLEQVLIKKTAIVIPLGDKYMSGYTLIDGIGASEKLVLSIASERKITQQAKLNLNLLYWYAVAIVLLLLVFSLLIDKLVLSRLAKLNNSVKRIGESVASVGRVQVISGNDELTSLTHSINGMLDRLDESQFALQFEQERAQVTLAGIADAVITSDMVGRVLYMNTSAERLTGVYCDDAKDGTLQTLFRLMNADKSAMVSSDWLIDVASGFEEVILERDDGVSFIITKSASPLLAHDGVLFGYVTVLHDVSMLRSLSYQLSYQARHDALTGLINRYEFDRKAQEAIDDAATGNRTHCIAYIDLDQFKVVNDSCGHMAGDQLLRQLADTMKAKVRNADTLARLGGDEFALILIGCDLQRAQKIVVDMLDVVQNYRFVFDDKVFKVGASIGLTEISSNQALTLSEILNTVDAACYTAKKEGGNRVHTHRFGDSDMKERSSQLEWVSRIHLALEKQHFVLYIQRMQSLGSSKELHCELLIRMQGEDDVLYPPGYFLPAAERYRLIPKIDRWVVAEALTIMARKGDSFSYVCAINLSGQTLSEEGFLEYVIDQIGLHGVDAKRICFEITETAVIANLDKARKFIRALRDIGCRFSLDDFGSGLSSFAYLKNLEVDFLKIDGMFVKAIANNKIDRAMVESINNIGHVMGLHTIAEFVENDETISVLKEIGVDYAQGYGVAKPELFE